MSLMNKHVKILNKIFSQPNPSTYEKDHTLQPSGIHLMFIRKVQHTQIN